MTDLHPEVVNHITGLRNLRDKNEEQHAKIVELEGQLNAVLDTLAKERSEASAKCETLQATIASHVKLIDWYSRNYAVLFSTFRTTAMISADAFSRAINEAKSGGMDDFLGDADRALEELRQAALLKTQSPPSQEQEDYPKLSSLSQTLRAADDSAAPAQPGPESFAPPRRNGT